MEFKKTKVVEQLFIAIFFVISFSRKIYVNYNYSTVINNILYIIQGILIIAGVYFYFKHSKATKN